MSKDKRIFDLEVSIFVTSIKTAKQKMDLRIS